MIKHIKRLISKFNHPKLIFQPNSLVDVHPRARQLVSGIFEFNAKWSKKDNFSSLFFQGPQSSLIVEGNFKVYSQSKVYINEGAVLKLGSGYINHGLNLSCFEEISIGHHVAISENVTIRDSDNHSLGGSEKPHTQPVKIGNQVWIGLNVTILKGVTVGDGAVIGAGSLVTSDIPARCLAYGVPAKVVKTEISWS